MNIFIKSFTKDNKSNELFKNITMILLSLFILGGLILISLYVGVAKISYKDILEAIFAPDLQLSAQKIVLYARLPRITGAIVVGSALSFSGLLLQITLNNSLASPSTIGVNAGSGFFTVAYIFFFGGNYFTNSIVAFLGAFITTLLVYGLAYKSGASRMTIILAGVAVSSLFNALVNIFTILDTDVLIDKNTFYIGGLSYLTMEQIYFALPYIVIGFIGALFIANKINILTLGDEIAQSLGVNVNKTRLLTIIFASCAASGAVSIAGLLGFVGLIVPHITMKVITNDFKLLVPFTAIFGAILVLLCDTLSRVLFLPNEVPVGIMLACIGSPFFIFLLLKSGKRGRMR